jgi:pimeloyl-ACP methyl ester carboxylesterase
MRSACHDNSQPATAQPGVRVSFCLLLCAWAGISAAVRAQPLSADPSLAAAIQAQAAGWQAEAAGQPQSIDYYCQAAVHAWKALQPADFVDVTGPRSRAWLLYHDALARIIRLAQQHQQFSPQDGIRLGAGGSPSAVPATFSGFSWQPEDFHQLLVVGEYGTESPRHIHRRAGLGVPLIVVRYQPDEQGHFSARHEFSATAVLHPAGGPADPGAGPALDAMTLEFFDPLTVRTFTTGKYQATLAADLTAPLAMEANQRERTYWQDFFGANAHVAAPKLAFLEPYRPGRIPLVLVHGLLSDAWTWLDVANDLRAVPQIMDRYQIWAFHYPTGVPFLESAAAFREQLHRTISELDPGGADPALRQMVLVGHSMGGLVSKLQVTHSGSTIWSRYVNRPLEQIVATPELRGELQRVFFFEPVPYVRRVVFIGVPHGGSSLASRTIGRIGAACVSVPPEKDLQRRWLLQYNPNTFSPAFNRRFPNSVDLLEPSSPLLAAMRQLPVAAGVQLHSIIGTGYPVAGYGDADGVVPVSSALHGGVQTQRMVHAKHESLHHQPESFEELLAILSIHAAGMHPAR